MKHHIDPTRWDETVDAFVLDLRCRMLRSKGPVGVAEAEALVDGSVAAKGEITFSLI